MDIEVKMKNLILSLLICFVLINLTFAQEDTVDSATMAKNTVEEKQFTTLGFKGIHLGMTPKEIDDLIKNSGWTYKYGHYGKEVFLEEEDYGYRATEGLARIGCDGGGHCYRFDYVFIEYFDDKVIRIYLTSSKLSANYIKRFVKNWGLFALKGLIKKYGKPDKTYISIEDINIFSFDEGFLIPLYEWQKGKERIRLYITEENSEFGCVVAFENIKGIKKIEEQKKNEAKTEF